MTFARRQKVRLRLLDTAVFLGSVALGSLIFWLSPWFTGQVNPLREFGPYYFIALAIAGFIPGFVSPRRFALWPLGIFFGQIIATGLPPLWPFLVVILAFLTLLPLLTSGAGAAFRYMLFPIPPPPSNLCAGCGYNLTGAVSPQCPECGAKIDHIPPARGV